MSSPYLPAGKSIWLWIIIFTTCTYCRLGTQIDIGRVKVHSSEGIYIERSDWLAAL